MIPTMFEYLPRESAEAILKIAQAGLPEQEDDTEEPSYGTKLKRAIFYAVPVGVGTGVGYTLGRIGTHLLDQRSIRRNGHPMLEHVPTRALQYLAAGLGTASGILYKRLTDQNQKEINRRVPKSTKSE